MDKFKNDIQQKFSQREIQPTDEAWGKITGELASSRARKTKSLWLWSGIAAGFIGLLVLLTPLYLSQSNSLPVVNSEEKETQTIEVRRESIVSVNQLQSRGIKIAPIQMSKSKLVINAIELSTSKNLTPTHLNPKTLLAEVEQELEEERFTQKNINEVDALLAQARANLTSKQDQELFDQLSAQQLLAEIDLEDSNSFRDKIWTLIEVNFKELKTSLGTR
jgi:hypothetical protein